MEVDSFAPKEGGENVPGKMVISQATFLWLVVAE